ncbi:MAG: hypothetical protein ABI587_14010 [Gemmatimonadales bacterium]
MTYEQIVATLGYAAGQELGVRIVTTDCREITGIPASVDTHLTAHEVYLHPLGDDSIEIALGLEQIREVELL